MPPIALPPDYNYAAVFLTLSCDLECPFCLTRFSPDDGRPRCSRLMPGSKWIEGLNRLELPSDLPVTLQGGEPSLHPDFFDIISGLKTDLSIDLLTNLQLNIHEFMERIPPERLRRPAPYASIRASYHPDHMEAEELTRKVRKLLDRGYDIGIWVIDHPAYKTRNLQMRDACSRQGIDFRVKQFLGYFDGKLMGTYRYARAIGTRNDRCRVMCRTTELIVSPSGHIHRCHSNLYRGLDSTGYLLDPALQITGSHRPCACYGQCHPCDIKIKTNRFQQGGHTSVEILFPREKDDPST